MHFYFCTECRGARRKFRFSSRFELPLESVLGLGFHSTGEVQKSWKNREEKHQSKELRGGFLGKVSCKFGSGGHEVKAKVIGAPRRNNPEVELGIHWPSKRGSGRPCLPKYEQQINKKTGNYRGESKEIHVWLWCLRGALNVCSSEMPSGCCGPLVPDGRKTFDGKCLVHPHLLTLCVVPCQSRKERRRRDPRKPLSYVWSSMGFFFFSFLFFCFFFFSFLFSFPSWRATFSCRTKGV